MGYFSVGQRNLFEVITRVANDQGVYVFVVGGVVRDLLRDIPQSDRDIDVVVEGNGIEFAKRIHQECGGELQIFAPFYTAKIKGIVGFDDVRELDVATARTELYDRPGSLPKVTPARLQEDLSRRDFTFNAFALEVKDLREECTYKELSPLVIDLFEGLRDLNNRCVRVLHEKSFLDDPTRLFRAVRYLARIDGTLDTTTEALFRDALHSKALHAVSSFRKWSEIRKILQERAPQRAFSEWVRRGGLDAWELWEPSRTTEMVSSIERLASEVSTDVLVLRFQTFLHLCYSLSRSELEGEALIRDAGFGKKLIATLNREESAPLEKLSVAALLARWARQTPDAEEAYRRYKIIQIGSSE